MVLLDWKELGPQSAVKGWRGRPEEKRFVIEIKQSLCPELVEAKSEKKEKGGGNKKMSQVKI